MTRLTYEALHPSSSGRKRGPWSGYQEAAILKQSREGRRRLRSLKRAASLRAKLERQAWAKA